MTTQTLIYILLAYVAGIVTVVAWAAIVEHLNPTAPIHPIVLNRHERRWAARTERRRAAGRKA